MYVQVSKNQKHLCIFFEREKAVNNSGVNTLSGFREANLVHLFPPTSGFHPWIVDFDHLRLKP